MGFRRSAFLLAHAAMAALASPGMALAALGPIPAEQQRIAPKRKALVYRPLNRSQHWPFAFDYKHARQISPVPHIPVR